MLTIYGRTSSVNVQKVLWCIGELGIPHRRVDAGLHYGVNNEDWYLALNPNGRIPLLVDGDFSLWESNSIVRYLAAKYDRTGRLYPASSELRAHAERWMDWQLSTLVRPVSIVFQNLVRAAPAERDPDAIAKGAREAAAAVDLLERHLATHPYVAGKLFTIGDIPVGATAYRWLALPEIERAPVPSLRRWQDRLAERPPFREHVMLPLA